MAAYAAVVSLMNNIEQIMNHHHLSNCFDDEQIQSLLHKAGSLLDFIEGYNYGLSATEEAEALERLITTAAHLVEDVIESHIVDHIHAGAADGVEEHHQLQRGSPNVWKKLLDRLRRMECSARMANQNYGGTVRSLDLLLLERLVTSAADLVDDVIVSHAVDQIHGGAADDVEAHHQLQREKSTNVRNHWLRRIASSARTANQNYGGTVPSLNLLLLERLATTAAHLVESQAVERIHAGSADDGTVRPLDLQLLIQYMSFVAEKAMEVKEKGVREEEQPPTNPRRPLLESRETVMVGLDDELTQLLDLLTGHHSNCHVISIVGMGGTGKTTLAQNLYANPLINEHFDIRAWATISQQYSSQKILSQLLSCLGESSSVDELGLQIHKTLYGRRYLIVLDDIWCVEAWDKVRCYFPDDGKGSRVVLTTRLSNVASDCGPECFNMNLLDEEKSWKLFREKALFPRNGDPLELEDVAREIVKQCKGLALSIVVVGGLLLKSPRSIGYWKNVLTGLDKSDSKEKQQGLEALSLSYNHLPPYLKPCFLYIGVFNEDSRIRVSNITRLWVAEGFIKPKGTQVLEEIAEDYLKDLSDRNLVLGMELRHTGKIKSFSIHDLLRDLCIKVAEQQQFFHVRKSGEDIQSTERRLVCDPMKREFGNTLGRSLLGRNCFPEYDECKLLRVLDATESMLVDSTKQIYGKVNLRYFAHQLILLYPSVCLLWNLQTLLIKVPSYSPLVLAPREIWKMRQLRHVKCQKLYLPPPPPPRNEQDYIENLTTLKRAVNLRLSEELCEIIPNIKTLGLLYNGKMRGYDDSLIDCLYNLDRFQKLESLNLEIDTSKWPSQASDSYSAPVLNTNLRFPHSLNKLCLSECGLCWEDLRMIGSLPHLRILHLKTRAVTVGEQWSPITGQFLRLKFLNIEFCQLYAWDADSSHFPVLEKLVLLGLEFLKEIQPEIGEIPTLGLIRVDRCSESSAISAVKIKEDLLENYDNDDLLIEVVVNDSDMKSFKKRVEEEELALNLFKLKTIGGPSKQSRVKRSY